MGVEVGGGRVARGVFLAITLAAALAIPFAACRDDGFNVNYSFHYVIRS